MNGRVLSIAVWAATVSFGAVPVRAQTTAAEQLDIKKQVLVAQLSKAKTVGTLSGTVLDPRANIELYLLSLALSRQSSDAIAREVVDARKTIEAARVDKQLGSSPSESGSTSLTEKGAVPRILAFAVENGALTRTQSGTTISFKANPEGIVKALAGIPLANGPWSRLALGLAFDANRGAADGQPVTFTGDRQQLSGFNAKYEFLNHRDPASVQFQARVDALYSRVRATALGNQKLLNVEGSMAVALTSGIYQEVFMTWSEGALPALQNAVTPDEVMQVLNSQLTLLSESLSLTPADRLALDGYLATYRSFLMSRDALLELAGKGAVMSLEYAHSRPVSQPSESTLTWLYEWSAVNGKVDFTANASATLLNGNLNDATERWKSWAIAGQMDLPLGSIAQGRSVVVTLSGRVEGKIVLPMNDREDIWVGQAKLTFPIKDAGVKLPVSLTVASRTDLIDETVVRGNVGLTLNLDSLLGI